MKFSNETEIKARQIFSRILDNAPSDSAIQALIYQSPTGYACRIRISSPEAYFGSENSGQNPFQALKRVEANICKQIELWKTTRFLTPNPNAKEGEAAS